MAAVKLYATAASRGEAGRDEGTDGERALSSPREHAAPSMARASRTARLPRYFLSHLQV